jgi:hypothetical protein
MEVQGNPSQIDELLLHLQKQRFVQIEQMDEEKIALREESDFRETW